MTLRCTLKGSTLRNQEVARGVFRRTSEITFEPRRPHPGSASGSGGYCFDERVVPGRTGEIAVEWGRIAARRPRGDADGLIAATAVVHDLIVVTCNVDDFADTGASVINPWHT
jgi:hypothetical protein